MSNNVKDISKQPLIEWGGQTVITTEQLADVYGATPKNITNNFNRNKDRFTEGRHYFTLQGEELKEFKMVASERGQDMSPKTSIAYLWTRRGASRHCKILGTDKAWEQFDYLEENYFDRQEQQLKFPKTAMELLELHYQALKEVDKKVDAVTEDVKSVKDEMEEIKDNLPVLPLEADNIVSAVKKRGVDALGGKQSNAYNDKSIRQKVYNDIYADLKRNFQCSTYKAIRRKDADKAVQIVNEYRLPLFLAEQIEYANSQLTIDGMERRRGA